MLEYDEWIRIMLTVEKLMVIRRRGMCYLEMTNFESAEMLAKRAGVNLMDWLNDYYDYENYD